MIITIIQKDLDSEGVGMSYYSSDEQIYLFRNFFTRLVQPWCRYMWVCHIRKQGGVVKPWLFGNLQLHVGRKFIETWSWVPTSNLYEEIGSGSYFYDIDNEQYINTRHFFQNCSSSPYFHETFPNSNRNNLNSRYYRSIFTLVATKMGTGTAMITLMLTKINMTMMVSVFFLPNVLQMLLL